MRAQEHLMASIFVIVHKCPPVVRLQLMEWKRSEERKVTSDVFGARALPPASLRRMSNARILD